MSSPHFSISPDYKKLPLNRAQFRSIIQGFKPLNIDIWGRGTGKSFMIAYDIDSILKNMPGSKGALAGPTYKKLMSDILPGIFGALERLGYLNNVHFVIGRRPDPKWGWKEPFEPCLSYDYVLTFYHPVRCVQMQLLSQDGLGSGRGVNFDWIIVDEALLIDKDKLDKDVLPANRGNRDRFGKCRFHHFIHYLTSQPIGLSSKWIHDLHDKANHNTKIRANTANVFDNIENLGLDYVKQLRDAMTELNFRVEVLNERIERFGQGFYSGFDDTVHTYLPSYDNNILTPKGFDFDEVRGTNSIADLDVDTTKPLELSADWGAIINSLVICQTSGGKEAETLKVVRAMFVKDPEGIDALATKFCQYYRNHPTRRIHFYYDRNGNSRVPNSSVTYAQQFRDILVRNRWSVEMMARTGADAYHADKYLLWQRILKGSDYGMPRFLINRENARELIISMMNAPLKEHEDKGIKKDKSSERSKTILPEHATHFSDAIDVLVWRKYGHKIRGSSGPATSSGLTVSSH